MIRVEVKKNEFAKIAAGLAPGVTVAVRGTAVAVSAGCKQRAPKNTGAMAAGFYTRHDGPFESHVSNPVRYWIFHEFGTHKMPAHPMVHPAVEAQRTAFVAAVTMALRGRGAISVPMF